MDNNKNCQDESCKIPASGNMNIALLNDIISVANLQRLRLKVFGKLGCEKCEFVKKYLQGKIEFDYYDISEVEGLTEAAVWDAIDIPAIILEKDGDAIARWSDSKK